MKCPKCYPVGRFSIDFAWEHLKAAIEIDGQQHDEEEYRLRDARKDKFLQDRGWKILRIKWKDMFANPRQEIQKCKIFISPGSSIGRAPV